MGIYRFERDLPTENSYDLVIAGGGPAGTAAAISAGRLGARVLLLEATGCLGGMGTSGLVSAFNHMADGEKLLARGIMEEIVETLYSRGFIPEYITPDSWRKNQHHWTPFNTEGLKLVLDELTTEAGAEVRFFTRVIDADVDHDSGVVNGVVIQNIEGLRYVPAKTFIDSTGDAVLSGICGVECQEPDNDSEYAMPATLCSLFCGIDYDRIRMGGINGGVNPELEQDAVRKAIAENHFSQPDTHVPGMFRLGKTFAFLNGGHIFKMNSLDNESLSNGMRLGRRLAQEYVSFYRKYIPGFEHTEHVATASLMGVRESRRIVGEYSLDLDDYKAKRKFPDQVGVFTNFIDIHPYECSEEEMKRTDDEILDTSKWPKKGEYFGLPYGILVPRGWKNLWVAGRCNSCDVPMHAAIRVMPSAAMMGQAAGTAAVQSIHTGKSAGDIRTDILVETLRRNGAFLPQEKLSETMTRSD